ncbi:MAG: nitroreductase family deazaflavin-dependent oxidoreductase [Pseudonocardiaceae bacterium]
MRWQIPRWAARAPVPLLRNGFGWLLGPRFLLLEHIGRRSGQPRHVVLEVIDRAAGGWYVVSAYGERAQWLRNIRRQPRVRVWWLQLRGVPAEAIVLDRLAARRVFDGYIDRNPRLAGVLARLTTGASPGLDGAELAEHLVRETVLVWVSATRSVA